MRQRKVTRYYCDFCGKSGGSKYWMLLHERGCTMNPLRVCKCCIADGEEQPYLASVIAMLHADLSDRISKDNNEIALANLRHRTHGCPVCILSALRQSVIFLAGFNFRSEMDKWRKENLSRIQDAAHSSYYMSELKSSIDSWLNM